MSNPQEREAAARQQQELGPALLFFGCRRPQHDFIYEDELRGFEAAGTLTRLEVAFSRHTTPKTYVQHRMAELAGAA
jgi:sulfite reductase alpha subunit-like flavoprotein